MSEKTKVKEFNSLPFEERKKIIYYTNEEKILTINQVLHKLKDSIGPYQRNKLNEWRRNIERCNEREYELVNNEQNADN